MYGAELYLDGFAKKIAAFFLTVEVMVEHHP